MNNSFSLFQKLQPQKNINAAETSQNSTIKLAQMSPSPKKISKVSNKNRSAIKSSAKQTGNVRLQ